MMCGFPRYSNELLGIIAVMYMSIPLLPMHYALLILYSAQHCSVVGDLDIVALASIDYGINLVVA